jgi:hypothetical protein
MNPSLVRVEHPAAPQAGRDSKRLPRQPSQRHIEGTFNPNICVCICVFMYLFMCVFTYVYLYMHMSLFIYATSPEAPPS